MATHESSAQGGSGGGSTTATTSSLGAASAGDLVVVSTNWVNLLFTSITDSAGGNTWTQVGSETDIGGGSGQKMRVYYSSLTNGGAAFTVTLTVSGTSSFPCIAADRFSGSSWALDVTAVSAPALSGTSGTSGATSSRATNTVMVGSVATGHVVSTTFTAGANIAWAMGGQVTDGTVSSVAAQEWFIASSSGTEQAEMSWTTSSLWAARVASFSFTEGGGALTWLPTHISVSGRPASAVSSGMTPRGSGA